VYYQLSLTGLVAAQAQSGKGEDLTARHEHRRVSSLKRLNEYLRAHDLSFSDALNVALFFLTIVSLVLAGIGIHLAQAAIDEAKVAGDHQDKQFNEQMTQLRSSASALTTARDLLTAQGGILSELQSKTAKQLEDERNLLAKLQTTTAKQLQLAELVYTAHPEPEITLTCKANSTRSVRVADISASNNKSTAVTVGIGPLSDVDLFTNVNCAFTLSNNGTQELQNTQLSLWNQDFLSELDRNADRPTDMKLGPGTVTLHNSGQQRVEHELVSYQIGNVPGTAGDILRADRKPGNTSTANAPRILCQLCSGEFNLHVSREATRTTLLITLSSDNANRITYAIVMQFSRSADPTTNRSSPVPRRIPSGEAEAMFSENVAFDVAGYKGSMTIMSTSGITRRIRLNFRDGGDLFGYAELEITGDILLGKAGILAYTNTFQRMRFLNGDGTWRDIGRKAISNGRLFIELGESKQLFTIYDIQAKSCGTQATDDVVKCDPGDDTSAVVAPEIHLP
jgi:hypothetical protein